MRARVFTIWLLGYIIGSMVAPLFETAPQLYMYMGLAFVLGSFILPRIRYVAALAVGMGIVFVSISLFQVRELDMVRKNDIISKHEVTMTGYVSAVPTTNEFGQTVPLEIDKINGLPDRAKLRLYAPTYPRLEYGQRLTFDTKVKPYGDKKWRLVKDGYVGEANLGEYATAGEQTGVIVTIKKLVFGLREKFNVSISRYLPAAESGLASGLILGEKALLTPEVTRQLQISGTTHIIALSGYNITIILSLFVLLEGKLSRRMRILVPLLFIITFVIMTGGAASLVRAAIMGFMPLVVLYLGRESDSFIAILLSATLMILFNPFLALYDVGFQLSFAALAGMIYLSPIIGKALVSLPEYVSWPLSETVGAQLAAMPLLAYYFGSVSLISPIANLVILSLVPFGMLTAFVIGLAGMIWQGLASFVAIPGYVILHLINWLVAIFGNIPAASKPIKIENPVWILMTYFVLFDIWLVFSKVRRERPTN